MEFLIMWTHKIWTKLLLQIPIVLAYPKASQCAETYPWQTHHQWKLLHFCSSCSISPCNWSNALQNWGSERVKSCLGIIRRESQVLKGIYIHAVTFNSTPKTMLITSPCIRHFCMKTCPFSRFLGEGNKLSFGKCLHMHK